MALTRKALKAMSLTDEQVESIMEMHIEVKEAWTNQLKEAQEKANKYDAIHQELEELKAKGDNDGGYKDKYEKEHEALENLKTEIANEKMFNKQTKSFKGILKEAKIADKYVPIVIKASESVIKSIKYDKDDNIENKDDLLANLKNDWEVFAESTRTDNADPPEPPEHNEDGSFESLSLAGKMEYANQHPNDSQVKEWLSK